MNHQPNDERISLGHEQLTFDLLPHLHGWVAELGLPESGGLGAGVGVASASALASASASAEVPSGLFGVRSNGKRWTAASRGCELVHVHRETTPKGIRRTDLRFELPEAKLEVEYRAACYPGLPVLETGMTVRNIGEETIVIDRLDSLALVLRTDDCQLRYFESGWGQEFEPIRKPLDREGGFTLETRQGRSSSDRHPWLTLDWLDGSLLTVCPAWPGNWIIRLEPAHEGRSVLSAGMNDWEFCAKLQPGEAIDSPPVVLALGSGGDLDTTAVPLARAGRRHWYPRTKETLALPVEWNHWFSYEDKAIDEEAFRRNVDEAARLGFEIAVLDAGWFGPSEAQANWYESRGDWDRVNALRFPSGIRALSDYTRAKGLRFGLWCEIEALGAETRLGADYPDYAALRDGEPIGYVCLGNPEARQWAFDTLDRLISDYRCDWIKLDYNLDPGAGCDRPDHGHGAGDGLYRHMEGYFEVLDRIREKYPDVVLENCSSGGLRIDLGILRHTHATFISDRDWPEHSLHTFWAATTMLAPDATLRFTFSEWMGKNPPQSFNPHDPTLQRRQFDYYTRIGMLGGLGYSQRLPELPSWMRESISYHNELYKRVVRRFVQEADMYRLTEQPVRSGQGERWAAFQYAMPDGSEHLLFAFRLIGGEANRRLALKGLDPKRIYTVETLTGERNPSAATISGARLMQEGIAIPGLTEEEAEIVIIS